MKFSEGMYGSQAMLGGRNEGPQLPGMENLGADAVVTGGIETVSDIPAVRRSMNQPHCNAYDNIIL